MTKKPAAKGGAKDLTNKKSSTGSNFPLTKKAKWGGTENGAKEQKGKDFKNGAKKDFKKGAKNAKFQKKGRLINYCRIFIICMVLDSSENQRDFILDGWKICLTIKRTKKRTGRKERTS